MKIGIILNTNDAETIWNAFRFGNEALKNAHSVKVFLLGKGVEIENAKDDRFPSLEGSIKKFIKNKKEIQSTEIRKKIEKELKKKDEELAFFYEQHLPNLKRL